MCAFDVYLGIVKLTASSKGSASCLLRKVARVLQVNQSLVGTLTEFTKFAFQAGNFFLDIGNRTGQRSNRNIAV